jgi:hypothetical protein
MKRRTVRQLAWVGVALCLVALALGVTVRVLEPPPGVTAANVLRIRPGMRPDVVERILGSCHIGGPAAGSPDGKGARVWVIPGGKWKAVVVVYSDANDRVISVEHDFEHDPTPLDRLRSLLGW